MALIFLLPRIFNPFPTNQCLLSALRPLFSNIYRRNVEYFVKSFHGNYMETVKWRLSTWRCRGADASMEPHFLYFPALGIRNLLTLRSLLNWSTNTSQNEGSLSRLSNLRTRYRVMHLRKCHT